MSDAAITDEELLVWKPRMGMLSVQDKIDQGEMLKKQANLFFKQGDYLKATSRYAKVFAYVNGLSVAGDAMAQYARNDPALCASAEQGVAINALKIACWSNMALCVLKRQDGPVERAIEYCDKVLAEDSTHSKARFRKAQALVQLKHFDKAQAILVQLASEEPTNAAVRVEHKKLVAAKKAYDAKAKKQEKKAFGSMFQQQEGLF